MSEHKDETKIEETKTLSTDEAGAATETGQDGETTEEGGATDGETSDGEGGEDGSE